MFPLWTYGYWQSKERYKSQKEVVDVVRKYRDLGVPLDGIIQDWQYWGHNYLWNAMAFLNPDYPNPKKMLDDVHAMNAHMAISIWSGFGPATKPYRELAAKGLLFDFRTWPPSGIDAWPPIMEYPSGVKVYDAYSPEARDIYWKYLNEGVFSNSAWMLGGWILLNRTMWIPRPRIWIPRPVWGPSGRFATLIRSCPSVECMTTSVPCRRINACSSSPVRGLWDSSVTGLMYGRVMWGSSWETLRNQVPAGLNFSLCGMPHWNHDIGGFFAGQYNQNGDGSAPKNPLYQELYVRWLQFGTFTPMMRSHGTNTPREIYQFGRKGEPVYDAIEKMIRLRYSLLPYIYSTSWDVSHRQSTFMRALVMDFPKDKKVWDMNDEYMFGKAFLVAPVLHAQYTQEAVVNVNELSGWSRDNDGKAAGGAQANFQQPKSTEVYLPSGTAWYDFWTNEKMEGGREITRETTLDLIPLYIKAGSIVPFGPDVQYATEKPWDNLVLRVYPGADGSFVLYEDEFDNYNYEKRRLYGDSYVVGRFFAPSDPGDAQGRIQRGYVAIPRVYGGASRRTAKVRIL